MIWLNHIQALLFPVKNAYKIHYLVWDLKTCAESQFI